jgi:hypothetical protein
LGPAESRGTNPESGGVAALPSAGITTLEKFDLPQAFLCFGECFVRATHIAAEAREDLITTFDFLDHRAPLFDHIVARREYKSMGELWPLPPGGP